MRSDKETSQVAPWAYGLKENARAIGKFLQYSYDAGVSTQKMSPKELFAPSIWDLTEV